MEITNDFPYLDDFFPDDNGLCILSTQDVSFALQKKSARKYIRILLIILIFPKRHWRKLSNTSYADNEEIVFEVIHPFHPLYKQKFKLITYHRNWESHRVHFYNSKNRFASLPTSWTSLFPRDLFAEQSAGRSLFKVGDLLSLNRLILTFEQEINQKELDHSDE